METIILSEFPKELIQHFRNLELKFKKHKLNPRKTSSEVSVHGFSVILQDMVTLSPLKNPMRGANCQHFECFNQETAELCLDEKCPLCDETINSLETDDYLKEIVSRGPFEAVYIDVDTGLYFPYRKKTQEIEWNPVFLHYLALKKGDKALFSGIRNLGISRLRVSIGFLDARRDLIEIPCRTLNCRHLDCVDFKRIWREKSCWICGEPAHENSIYVDKLLYGVYIFARQRFGKEKIKEVRRFGYFEEYNCFEICGKYFDFEFRDIAEDLRFEIENRVKTIEEMEKKLNYLDERKAVNLSEKPDFLDNFKFPEPATELNELHYDDVDTEIMEFSEKETIVLRDIDFV